MEEIGRNWKKLEEIGRNWKKLDIEYSIKLIYSCDTTLYEMLSDIHLFARFVLLFIVVVIFYASCKNTHSIASTSVQQIVIQYAEDDEFAIEKFIRVEKVIRLETSVECVVDRVSKLIYNNGKFYVFDRRSKKVFCFDEEGKFITTIGKHGKGPSEYLSLLDISFDLSGTYLYFLDFRRMHIYNPETFEYIESVSLDFDNNDIYNPASFATLSKEQTYFWFQRPDSYNVDSIEFYCLAGRTNNSYEYFYPFNTFGGLTADRFTRTGDGNGYYCALPMNDMRILKITADQKPALEYDFVFPNPMPNEFLIKKYANHRERLMNLTNSPYEKAITRFYEADGQILFRFVGKSGLFYEVLYSKETGATIAGKRQTSFPVIEYSDGAYFYGMLPAENVFNQLNEGKRNKFLEKLEEVREEISELDNPIIFKFKILPTFD